MKKVITNMYDEISGLLAAYKHPRPRAWMAELPKIAPETTTTTDVDLQRFFANRAFRMIFAAAERATGESTYAERLNLVDDCNLELYLKIFEGHVLPKLVLLDLPPLEG